MNIPKLHVRKLQMLRDAILTADKTKITSAQDHSNMAAYLSRISFELCFPEIPDDDDVYDLITATYHFLKDIGIDAGIDPSRPT